MLTDKQTAFLDSFADHGFSVTDTCAAVGISRQTFYVWKDSSPEFLAAFEQNRKRLVELAERNLFRFLEEGDKDMTKFALEKLAKNKGYGKEVVIQTKGEPRPPIAWSDEPETEGDND